MSHCVTRITWVLFLSDPLLWKKIVEKNVTKVFHSDPGGMSLNA
jgi:hypothetical protein